MTEYLLEDHYKRNFYYLRLSITDICNFRCKYCLPDGYEKKHNHKFLTLPEITRVINAFSDLGIVKVRLTGGEPTLRKDFPDIIEAVNSISGINKLAITTNGYKLDENIENYYNLGLRNINISIDSLDRRVFHDLTKHDRLPNILSAIDKAINLEFDTVKINTVLMNNVNNDITDFLKYIKDNKVSIRFIELMRNGTNIDFFETYHLRASGIIEQIKKMGWEKIELDDVDKGPAQVFRHSDYKGELGFITPYASDFCLSCNRLRVSSLGDLYLCLFGGLGYRLRHLLKSDSQKEELKEHIIKCVSFKLPQHYLQENITGANKNFSMLGG